MNPTGQNEDLIDLGADAKEAELRAFDHGAGAVDFPRLLLFERGSDEGIKGVGIFEMNGDDTAVIARGRFDGFNDGVRRAAGGKAAAGDLVGRVKLDGAMRKSLACRGPESGCRAEDHGEIATEFA